MADTAFPHVCSSRPGLSTRQLILDPPSEYQAVTIIEYWLVTGRPTMPLQDAESTLNTASRLRVAALATGMEGCCQHEYQPVLIDQTVGGQIDGDRAQTTKAHTAPYLAVPGIAPAHLRTGSRRGRSPTVVVNPTRRSEGRATISERDSAPVSD